MTLENRREIVSELGTAQNIVVETLCMRRVASRLLPTNMNSFFLTYEFRYFLIIGYIIRKMPVDLHGILQ